MKRYVIGHLYETHREEMLAVARAIVGDDLDAEEVVQEVFIELCGNNRKIRDEIRYLTRAVKNRAIDFVRKREREDSRLDSAIKEGVYAET